MKAISGIVLLLAVSPFAYYLIAIFSTIRFFRRGSNTANGGFTPPVTNIKPVRGVDPEAYENFASFCRQDYPEYELLFCVDGKSDPNVPILEKLAADFPNTAIRIIFGSGRAGTNDKVSKLATMSAEAKYETLVINDSDVRVDPAYFRTVVAPLADPAVGAVTSLYRPLSSKTFNERLHVIGMTSDFFAGIIVAWQLDGVHFAIGKTIVTTRAQLADFGGYESLENRPADDLWVGRLIAERGARVELLSYAVDAVADYANTRQFLEKRLRWIVVMRHMRPWGHIGLIFTHGLPWCILAIAVHPTAAVALAYGGLYALLRALMTFLIGSRGLKLPGLWKKLPLIPLWDAVALGIWLVSFTRNRIRWRNGEYYIRNGQLIPIRSPQTGD